MSLLGSHVQRGCQTQGSCEEFRPTEQIPETGVKFCLSPANYAKLGILVLASLLVVWRMSIAGNLNKSEQKFLDCIRFRLFYGLYVPSHHFNFSCGEPVFISSLFVPCLFLAYFILLFLFW